MSKLDDLINISWLIMEFVEENMDREHDGLFRFIRSDSLCSHLDNYSLRELIKECLEGVLE